MGTTLIAHIVSEEQISVVKHAFSGDYDSACYSLMQHSRFPKYINDVDLRAATAFDVCERLFLMKSYIQDVFYRFLVDKLLPPFILAGPLEDCDYSFMEKFEFGVGGYPFCMLPPPVCKELLYTSRSFNISDLKQVYEIVFRNVNEPRLIERSINFDGDTFERFSDIIQQCLGHVQDAAENDCYLVTYLNP